MGIPTATSGVDWLALLVQVIVARTPPVSTISALGTIASTNQAEDSKGWTGGATGAPPRPDRGWIVYARTTTISAQPSSIDAGIAFVRDEVMPALQEMDGYVGLSLLVDRQSGQAIATSAWESDEAQRASADRIKPVRDRAAQAFGGSATVEAWEIAVLHREHSSDTGACVRATWVTLPPDQADAGIEYFRSSVLPQIEHLDGFCSASLLIDRGSGRAVSSVSFGSRDAMERNRDQSRALKSESIREAGASEVDEREFDLALAHLRVPEMT
jgi:heme-degrading monooxygenase HmoA